MNYFPLVVLLTLGVVFWFLDSVWNLFGKQFLSNFFFAGGLHPGEQYIYIIVLSLTNIIAIFLSFLRKDIWKNGFHFSKGLFLYFLFIVIISISTLFFSVDKFESYREFWIYLLMFSLSIYIYNFVFNQKDKEEFLYNYCLILLTIFIVSILIAVIVNLGLPTGSPWMSLFYQKNAYGGFILLFLPITFSLFLFSMVYKEYYKSIIFFTAFIFGIFTLIFSGSKAAFLSFLICLPLYFAFLKIFKLINPLNIMDKKIKRLFIIAAFFSVILLFLQLVLDSKFTFALINSLKTLIFGLTNTVIARVDFWEASLKIAKDFPFGCGLYNFSKVYPLYQASFYFYSKDPHNYYLKLISEIGYIGFIFFITMIVYFIYKSSIIYSKVYSFLVNQYNQRKIFSNSDEMDNNLSKLGIYILSSGISIGLIQGLLHIAFDVDFKFAYILVIFTTNFFVNMAIIDSLESNLADNNKNLKSFYLRLLWAIIFIPLSLLGLHYGIKESIAYKIDKEVEKTGDYKQYIRVINNSLSSSSKYVTLAELYRVSYNFEEAIKYNKKAIELCKYNMNAYLSLSFLYNDKIESLLSINTEDTVVKDKVKRNISLLSQDLKKTVVEAFKYDNKNYPDFYLLLAQSYEYKNSKNYKNLYKNIFKVVYPPSEYINLMDIRHTTFGDIISQAYIKYLIDDFIKCQKDKGVQYCEKVTEYLYEPLIKYNIKTNIEDFYLLGAISFYITGKKLYNIDHHKSIENFKKAKEVLEKIYTQDFVNLYYYTACYMYLGNYTTSLGLAKIIFSFPMVEKLSNEQKEKLKLAKINNYAILSYIYTKQNYIKLAEEYAKLYTKYSETKK
ncbi:MAG: O-antigen ligase family protein [Candidatus Calescibacterium sp.]|nr:O-antigen ligase family protein [Candidatus Calescibacterium sp.]MDW8132310.1 O-antigen ligase family protein [Candidatus Calescibacterium sp.]